MCALFIKSDIEYNCNICSDNIDKDKIIKDLRIKVHRLVKSKSHYKIVKSILRSWNHAHVRMENVVRSIVSA